MSGISRELCKAESCKAPVIFAQGPNGRVVLDARAPVYRVTVSPTGLTAERVEDCFVSHFATCKDPKSFSRAKGPA